MDCISIIKKYMEKHGFDGLQNGAECGCTIDYLAPCGEDFSVCTPGFKVVPPSGEEYDFDFYICANKDDRPWETE